MRWQTTLASAAGARTEAIPIAATRGAKASAMPVAAVRAMDAVAGALETVVMGFKGMEKVMAFGHLLLDLAATS